MKVLGAALLLPKLSDFSLDMHRSLAHQGSAKILSTVSRSTLNGFSGKKTGSGN